MKLHSLLALLNYKYNLDIFLLWPMGILYQEKKNWVLAPSIWITSNRRTILYIS